MKCRLCGQESGLYIYCSDCDDHRQDDNEVEAEDYEERIEGHGIS